MIRIARIGYITGSLVSIVTGVVHNTVQATILSAPSIVSHLDAYGVVAQLGPTASLTNLFMGLSYLMGFFVIALGAVNLAALYARPKGSNPPVGIAIINIMMLVTVSWAGFVYLSAFQSMGGLAGIVMFGLTLWSAWQLRTAK